ncbi:aldo/keto reductase [bacterium (Candidatus Blackallbacteria) CG17_big_fil_post_rev_8_21_14_2_50_48_46]|uniref:Aldo/keto reductase n=1 Tax=bacterium (Candidatus Blackallbacteria) CG17_big_fil_post_rev_8_21_14_2_50_48_46 TaxID=2014261 RepID=A0A2M7FZR7_9BACT|nr:MAG: xylose reductase [bacterium (Candidatus Blackallbacteria) CG18_big_fil_WC_8_21_14_2_50_49_26]PIW14904.1 MAG: aldo/keto reductase [bacterium (Candidatus Blackallbacteria) CG17_big_fil_post_rev_8_21_14_2_50_48_46]PIW44308.1 MAG: aldo/keto reductase [bacterium (Candidatus Blackallbacteria) CG13_big_fil_rev_8_21_14_2_50_49_14]
MALTDSAPLMIYGTAWKEENTETCVLAALKAGFRAIDTANQRKHYHEAGVGNALLKAYPSLGLKREELFLQTKFTYQAGQDHRLPYDPAAPFCDQVEQSFQSSLEHLHCSYLDAYLLHGPSTRQGLTAADLEVWQQMEKLYAQGKVKKLGVSNFSRDQLALLLEKAHIAPRFIQNRCYAQLGWDAEVRSLCQSSGIQYQGFSLLTANLREFQRPWVAELLVQYACSLPQLIFAFARQIGMLALTGTTNPAHMQEDLAAFELTLSQADLQALENLAFS